MPQNPSSTSALIQPSEQSQPDYNTLSPNSLISRIHTLESQLREQTALLTRLTSNLPARDSSPPRRPLKPFNASNYSTRHISIKFSYIGTRYNGYEHANGTVPPKPTVEEVLWKALRKARLISPTLAEGSDQEPDVIWSAKEREDVYVDNQRLSKKGGHLEKWKRRLDVNWEGCGYSKCGRTDRGVSAFGQVVGVRVRSLKPKMPVPANGAMVQQETSAGTETNGYDHGLEDEMPGIEADDLSTSAYTPPFDPVRDELPYISILNNILPPDIRVLAWCPDPPSDFDARFSCRERRYKYFFTNPAFLPIPGPSGMLRAGENRAALREGWLDIEKMKQAAKKLEGLHDFRNLCKIDASKQMPNCIRRIRFADIKEFDSVGGGFETEPDLASGRATANGILDSVLPGSPSSTPHGPKVYTFDVHGNAFLWHQVRCMVAILFLVGQGLEQPSVVDELLDIEKSPCKPNYEMADDTPLVLWDCVFPSDTSDGKDALNWVYAGDAADVATQNSVNDNKFGSGGLLDGLWSEWRQAKIKEVQAGCLLDLALRQGDGTALKRGGFRHLRLALPRGQLLFKGGDNARSAGPYVPIMERPRLDSLAVQNERYIAGRAARREMRKDIEEGDDDR